MSGSAASLCFVARRLIQFEQRFALAPLARKLKSSFLFRQIAQSLDRLATDLERDQLPHEACRDLIYYSTQLKDCVGEELGSVETERLVLAMSEASQKEKNYLEYRSSLQKKHLKEELEKASILMRALANGIHPSPAENAFVDLASQNPSLISEMQHGKMGKLGDSK